ncbi:MAG: terpene cyclase/mutase family protein [Planctomycetia bacterium]|nr:terpene cyclase/mutase family protein [Planctomycetia bacterium]
MTTTIIKYISRAFLCASALALIAISPAFAQGERTPNGGMGNSAATSRGGYGSDTGRGAGAVPGGGLDALFNRAKNAQGQIVLADLPESVPSVLLDRVKAADKNGDGVLDEQEQAALASQRRAPQGSPVPTQAKKRAALADAQLNDLDALRLEMLAQGVAYLKSSQSSDGSFSASPRVGIGPTIVDAIGLLRAGVKPTDSPLREALAFLEGAIRDDGGVYSEGGHISCYESCLGAVCFDLANKAIGDGRYDKVVANAEQFIRRAQYNEENGYSREDAYFGGVGYGDTRQTRPDLSNTQFFVEALRELGAEEDDRAIQDALVFVSRCQNLESEDNPVEGSTKTNDGGFIYTFVSGDENPAGQEVNGGLRSYGSMTYAGLKSLIYAGLTQDDPRVEAATKWIAENYSMEQNPGLGKKGLYYYYHTLSKCFQVIGASTFDDATGVAHDWRKELLTTLALAQNADGSWVNEERMWYETDANLVTGYVLIVLSYCALPADAAPSQE